MNELSATLRICLANTFVMYFKAHSAHWNTEGCHFAQNHEFFGGLYEDLHGAVDPLAENLRKLDVYAPNTIEELYHFKTIQESGLSTDPFVVLLAYNNEIISGLSKLFDLATEAKEQGLANFAADRMDQHRKHGWQLKASLKKLGE